MHETLHISLPHPFEHPYWPPLDSNVPPSRLQVALISLSECVPPMLTCPAEATLAKNPDMMRKTIKTQDTRISTSLERTHEASDPSQIRSCRRLLPLPTVLF